jgi:hypothetical protein
VNTVITGSEKNCASIRSGAQKVEFRELMAPMQIGVEPVFLLRERPVQVDRNLRIRDRRFAENWLAGGRESRPKIDMRQGIASTRRHVAPARLLC